MTGKLEVYKCEVCQIVVEVLDGGAGECSCCGQKMVKLEEKTKDAATEKHVPFIEKVPGGVKVRVGQNAAHPMEDKHFIQWIELLVDGKVCRKALKPGDAPEAFFPVTEGTIVARELCNIHGLWKG